MRKSCTGKPVLQDFFVSLHIYYIYYKLMEDNFDIRQERQGSSEKDFENALRPLRFGDFSGQPKVVENLEVFVEAA